MSKLLSAKDILGSDDLKTDEVEVPEWGGSVKVRALTGDERDQYETYLMEASAEGRVTMETQDPNTGESRRQTLRWRGAKPKLVSMAAIDEDGERIFSESDVKKLGDKNSRPLDRVATRIMELSGLTESDVEEIAKNSAVNPNGGRGSD